MFWPILPSLFCSLACWLRCVDKTHPVQKNMGRILRLLFHQSKALLDDLCGAIGLITRVPCVKAVLLQNRKEQNCRCFDIFFWWDNFLSHLYWNCFFLPSARILSLTYPLLQIFLFVFRVHIAHLDPVGSEIVADDWISRGKSTLSAFQSPLFRLPSHPLGPSG